jgi:hypothetical protein
MTRCGRTFWVQVSIERFVYPLLLLFAANLEILIPYRQRYQIKSSRRLDRWMGLVSSDVSVVSHFEDAS